MVNSIRTYFTAVVVAAMLMLPAMMVLGTGVADAQLGDAVCQSADNTAGDNVCTNAVDGETVLNDVIQLVVLYFTIIVGAVAVIMIVFGGFRYITSGGDATKVQSAKNTILYALVGLVIVVLANLIIGFVVGTSREVTGG